MSILIKEETILQETIALKILFFRGQKVILDRDMALLYGVRTIALRQQVKRNLDRFPSDFMFQLDENEVEFLLSQNVIPSKKVLGGYTPYVFSEQGVSMLSSILTSKRAVLVNIQIMRTFVKLRQMLSIHKDFKEKLHALEKKYDLQFKMVFDAIKKLMIEEEKPKYPMGFYVKK